LRRGASCARTTTARRSSSLPRSRRSGARSVSGQRRGCEGGRRLGHPWGGSSPARPSSLAEPPRRPAGESLNDLRPADVPAVGHPCPRAIARVPLGRGLRAGANCCARHVAERSVRDRRRDVARLARRAAGARGCRSSCWRVNASPWGCWLALGRTPRDHVSRRCAVLSVTAACRVRRGFGGSWRRSARSSPCAAASCALSSATSPRVSRRRAVSAAMTPRSS
jgi:hypothetical protein